MLGYWASATDRSATNRAWGWHPHGEIWSLARMKKSTMIGSVAANFHEGSRSEILADYLFSSWGTVSPVRRQDVFAGDPSWQYRVPGLLGQIVIERLNETVAAL